MKKKAIFHVFKLFFFLFLGLILLLLSACSSNTTWNAPAGNTIPSDPSFKKPVQIAEAPATGFRVKRYPRTDILPPHQNEGISSDKNITLNYPLNDKGRKKDFVIMEDRLMLPSGNIVRAWYNWSAQEDNRLVYTEIPILEKSVLDKIIGCIEKGPVYKIPCTELCFSGAFFSLNYDKNMSLDLHMDSTGYRFILSGSWKQLNFSLGDYAGYYCVTSPELGEFLKKLTGWKPFEAGSIKEISKVVFVDKKDMVEVEYQDSIRPIADGLRKASIASRSACPFDRYIQLHLSDGSMIKMVLAGDGCNMAALESTFYELDRETIKSIHTLAHDVGLDWWDWEFKQP